MYQHTNSLILIANANYCTSLNENYLTINKHYKLPCNLTFVNCVHIKTSWPTAILIMVVHVQ